MIFGRQPTGKRDAKSTDSPKWKLQQNSVQRRKAKCRHNQRPETRDGAVDRIPIETSVVARQQLEWQPVKTYAEAIITKTSQNLTSSRASLTWPNLIFRFTIPVCPARSLSTATTRSSGVKNHALDVESGQKKQDTPKSAVRQPAKI